MGRLRRKTQRFSLKGKSDTMKKYISPEIEMIKYNDDDILIVSSNVKKNGKYNVEFNYQEWNDDII